MSPARYQKRYANRTLDEINYLLEHEKKMHKQAEHGQLQKEIDFISEVDEIVKPAVKHANEHQSKDISKAEKTRSIKGHRKAEREKRQEEILKLGDEQPNKKNAEVLPFDQSDDEEKYARPSIKEFLRRRKGQKEDE